MSHCAMLDRALAARFALVAGLVALVGVACSGAGEKRGEPSASPQPIEPSLPTPAAQFAPAHTRIAGDGVASGERLARVDTCQRCHPGAYQQWAGSAHSFASFNNPVYRVSIDGFRARQSPEASRFCAGCHDIALLIDGAMDRPVAADDARAHAGVGCRVCHGVEAVRADGNGSFELRPRPIPIPSDDTASIERHRQAVSVRALGSDLCRSCHRSFLGAATGNGHHLVGMDEFTDWQQSAYAGQGTGRIDTPIEQRDCVDCHMAKESVIADEVAAQGGAISSHRFLGAHTWLAAMRSDDAQVHRIQEQLRGVLSIDIAVAVSKQPIPEDETALVTAVRSMPADGAPVFAQGELQLDVVVRNVGVGHRFPGGVRDAQDAWIEVILRDAEGRELASSGRRHRDDASDSEAHVFRLYVADEAGQMLSAREVDRFRASIVDHTIPPRDAVVVRYAWTVPAQVKQPLTVEARVLHRSRNLVLQAEACASAGTEAGQAFARASLQHRGQELRPCEPQPITRMAETSVRLGAASASASASASQPAASRPDWQRLYEHGLAWTHAVQERLDEARPSLLGALDRLPESDQAGPRERAMVLTALGRLAGRQGRTDEALDWLRQAAEAAPGQPAISAARGAALMRVWRWREAEAPLRETVQKVPENTAAWAALAVTLGSLGKDRDALEAAQQGLALEPRHTALLRVQALSLRALGAPGAERALDAYDQFRKPDRAMDIRFACAAASAACAREREPVHVHRLQSAAAPIP